MAPQKKSAKAGSRKVSVDQQRGKQRKQPRGKPFEKGNQIGFKPGQSGNPIGRPKGVKFLSEAYREWLGAPSKRDPERPNADLLAEVIGEQALAGDIAAAREICDRAEGKPRQAIDLSADEQKRKLIENAIDALMRETGVERDTAVKDLLALVPEASQWIQ